MSHLQTNLSVAKIKIFARAFAKILLKNTNYRILEHDHFVKEIITH